MKTTEFLLVNILVMTGWNHVTAGETCQGPRGGIVAVGKAWVAKDGCNVCTCTQFGVECQTWRNCDNHDHLGAPGDPVCSYGVQDHYTVGQKWRAADGCNDCVCTAIGMNCTAQPCGNARSFATPKPPGSHMEFEDCRYKDKIYHYGDHFLADDGCNTCVCSIPGNFATFPSCTTTPCAPVG
ncbi:SCO-spondin-like [Littorina saxatilis]|uniref:VWFC domain-containing protein n=1 Tax=Littorina saxatilis TaxID=31220 RepID=A0AAN9GIB7_9CAEN